MITPGHLGIVMDGNGRWAVARGMPRTKGHLEGLKAAKRITRAAREAGIGCLSLYVFSTENWRRPAEEVGFLMDLVARHLAQELAFYEELGLRVVHTGDRAALGGALVRIIDGVVARTAGNSGMTVNLALNHGGRDEILRAASRWAREGGGGELTAEDLRRNLDVPDLPDLDLVIRTGGEMRLSNFLLWQAAYAELVFSPVLWPDFTGADLHAALAEYASRDRRFGAVPALSSAPPPTTTGFVPAAPVAVRAAHP
jgi:undecaprenyl diphosphate synthase